MAITFGSKVFGSMAWLVPVGVACSTFGAANGEAFTSARLSLAAGSNNHFPRFLSYLRKGEILIFFYFLVNPQAVEVENSK